MLIGTPVGELREVVEDLFRLGVEDVRTVQMNQDAMLVVEVIGVAGDVRALVDDEHTLAQTVGEPFREHGAGEARADDEVIVSFAARRGMTGLYRLQ